MGIRKIVEQKCPWFMRKINEYLMEGSVKKQSVGYFRPSDFVELPENTCFRELFYVYIGLTAPTEFDLSSIKRMMAGTAHHNLWEGVFKEAGIKTESGKYMRIKGDSVYVFNHKVREFELFRNDEGKDYPDIRGRCDWSVASNGDEWELIEWKTGKNKQPKGGQMVQWNLYSIITGIKKGWLIFEDRDDANPYPVPIERDEDLLSRLFVGLRNIEECAKKYIMIEKDPRCLNGVWKPKYCEQYELCFSEKGDNPWT